MTWSTLDPNIRATAEHTLTDKQLAAWKLELAGWGLRRIAQHLGVSRAAIRDRLDLAHLTLSQHGIRQDASGNYHQEKPRATAA